MTKENLEKLIFETPNDFELGKKIRKNALQTDTEVEETKEPNYKDLYLRSMSDLENYRKRVLKEKEELVFRTKTSMIDSILDIDSDIALAARQINDKGIDLIVSKVDKFLKSQGIETIQTETYDVDSHEVISIIQGETPDSIIDVVSKGYKMGDKIIRFPKVILSK